MDAVVTFSKKSSFYTCLDPRRQQKHGVRYIGGWSKSEPYCLFKGNLQFTAVEIFILTWASSSEFCRMRKLFIFQWNDQTVSTNTAVLTETQASVLRSRWSIQCPSEQRQDHFTMCAQKYTTDYYNHKYLLAIYSTSSLPGRNAFSSLDYDKPTVTWKAYHPHARALPWTDWEIAARELLYRLSKAHCRRFPPWAGGCLQYRIEVTNPDTGELR